VVPVQAGVQAVAPTLYPVTVYPVGLVLVAHERHIPLIKAKLAAHDVEVTTAVAERVHPVDPALKLVLVRPLTLEVTAVHK